MANVFIVPRWIWFYPQFSPPRSYLFLIAQTCPRLQVFFYIISSRIYEYPISSKPSQILLNILRYVFNTYCSKIKFRISIEKCSIVDHYHYYCYFFSLSLFFFGSRKIWGYNNVTSRDVSSVTDIVHETGPRKTLLVKMQITNSRELPAGHI